MYYVITCRDKPDSLPIRLDNRDAHLAGLKTLGPRVLTAGPLLGPGETDMVGSLLIIEFADRPAAEDFVRNDPYNRAGLFENVDIQPWRKVIPTD
jgi:uncharacterized protein YciI